MQKDNRHFELLFSMIIYTLAHETSIHLFLSSGEIHRRVIQTKYTASFVTLSEKKRLTNLQKYQLQKNFFSMLLHPISVRRWGLVNPLGKMSNFQKFFGLRPRSKLSTGKTWKPTVASIRYSILWAHLGLS